MSDAERLSTSIKALDEIAIICSGVLSHGADGAGVVEILEAISAKARGALMDAPAHTVDFLSMARSFQIGKLSVEWRNDDLWAVTDCGSVLSSDGEWVFEPLPSRRTDEFKARTRFDRDTAFEMARKLQDC